MSNNQNSRVLNRLGARELTVKELEVIAAAGGPVHTEMCTVPNSYKSGGSTTCDVES